MEAKELTAERGFLGGDDEKYLVVGFTPKDLKRLEGVGSFEEIVTYVLCILRGTMGGCGTEVAARIGSIRDEMRGMVAKVTLHPAEHERT